MSNHPRYSRYDAVVIGARCAGAATAMLLARRGLRVVAVDRSRYGTDTLSTHALMRGGVLQLHRWGLLERLRATGVPPVHTTSFHYDTEVIDVEIKPKDGVDALYAPRRTVIDALLDDAAVEAGVEMLHRVRLTELSRDEDGRVSGVVLEGADRQRLSVEAGIVIGADGRDSTVARLAGAETLRLGETASGVIYGYWAGLDIDGYHWYYRPGVGAGYIPTNDGQTCVFAAVSAERFHDEFRSDLDAGYHRILEECSSELAASVRAAEQVGRFRGFAGERGFLRQSHGPGWALVGDAAYFKDPITAHGMTDALRDAELLARAVVAGSDQALADYQATRDELSIPLFEATEQIAGYDWTLAEAQEIHLRASKEMGREVRALLQLGPFGP